MKVASLVLVFVLVSAPFSMATKEYGSCGDVLRHGGQTQGIHRYGPLDIGAIENFCELAESAESLKSITSADAEACISAKFDAVKNSGLSPTAVVGNGNGQPQYDIDAAAGRSVEAYHATQTRVEHESIRASLEKGFDHFNALTGGDYVSTVDGTAFEDTKIAALFNEAKCELAISNAQSSLQKELASNNIVVSKTSLNKMKKSLREQFAARAGATWIKRLVDLAQKDTLSEIDRSSECAKVGQSASAAAAKVVEAVAKHKETIQNWESGKATPVGDSPTDLTDAIKEEISALRASTKSLAECSKKHHEDLNVLVHKLAMLNKASAESEKVVALRDTQKELAFETVLVNGYNSYQRLKDGAGVTFEN